MADNDDITFDANSGISIEEQQKIMTQINGIAEKNRRSLSQNTLGLKPGKNPVITAKKKGTFFPLAVNITAIVVLCAGVLLLVFFNRKTDTQIRTGSGVMEVAAIQQGTSDELDAAIKELEMLTDEMEKAEAIERLLGGSLSNVYNMIRENHLIEAAETLKNSQQFIDSPAFQSVRSIQARKEFYIQTINSLGTLIEVLMVSSDLRAENLRLETVLETERSRIEGPEGLEAQAARVPGLQNEIRSLKPEADRVPGLVRDNSDLRQERNNLEREKNTLKESISERWGVVGEKDPNDISFGDINRLLAILEGVR